MKLMNKKSIIYQGNIYTKRIKWYIKICVQKMQECQLIQPQTQIQPNTSQPNGNNIAGINFRQLHSLDHKGQGAFEKVGGKVQLIEYDGQWWQCIFNKSIEPQQSANFKLKITQVYMGDMSIGVTDYEQQKDSRRSYGSGNAMCYYGRNGYKYPNDGTEGSGFKQGDVMEVEVDRTTRTIKYIVNGTVQATHYNSLLADNTRIFYPFVEMCQRYDAVEWLPC